MNTVTRILIVATSLALCGGGLVLSARQLSNIPLIEKQFMAEDMEAGYEFASTDPAFPDIESIVRGDAAKRFPKARLELGSVRAERGGLMMTVVVFGNRQTGAFLYELVPSKNSWRIANAHPLRYMRPSQIARGLRV